MNPSLIEQECAVNEVLNLVGKAKYDFEFEGPSQPEYSKKYPQFVQQFKEEYRNIAKWIQPNPKKHFLFEVMRSAENELTRQGQQQGLPVKRFGLQEGDLKTTVGRRNLFCHLARDRPEHIWISPTCGPWCQWSNLNMSKSAELRDKILQSRKENLWQISLSQVPSAV